MKPGVTVVVTAVPPRIKTGMLGKALASVTKQTRLPEAVIVSIDTEAKGEAPTRNAGLFAVQTEWTAFLDDDDVLYPHHLETLMAHTEGQDLVYCVDEETEILTAAGWRSYQDVSIGDDVLTLNHDSGQSEWQPLLAVNIFPAQEREMILMQSRDHSSLTTPYHRWPIEARCKYPTRLWRTTEALKASDRVPIAGVNTGVPLDAKYSDAFVELIAWFWTEGHIDPRTGRSVSLCQSSAAPDRCARIRSCLTEVFGEPVEAMPRRGSTTDGIPRWRESHYGTDRLTTWHLSADAGDVMQEIAPGRVVAPEFLLSLTRAQLLLFIETSLLADNDGFRSLAQKDRRMAEAFQFAVTLAGYASSLRHRVHKGCEMWRVYIRTSRGFTLQHMRRQRVVHVGEVWCPTTANGTWMARRRGTMYFTGNSKFDVKNGTDPFGDISFDADRMEVGNYIPVTYLVRTLLLQSVGGFPEPFSHDWNFEGCADWGAHKRMLRAGARYLHVPEKTWAWVHSAGPKHEHSNNRPWSDWDTVKAANKGKVRR